MHIFRSLFVPFLIVLLLSRARAADALVRREWNVDGQTREALVYAPPGAKSAATPVVFAFHGHYGTMNFAARKFDFQTLWPEALVVYPQGLPTVSKIVDPAGKFPGWQTLPGDYGDRDLKFFNAMLATLRQEYHVDDKRIYAVGHSNGGLFSYLLWSARGDQLAAIAPCAALIVKGLTDFKPKPVFHLAGQNDPIVKFAWQQFTIEEVKRTNQCSAEGQPWADKCTLYPSKVNAPLVTYIHPGGHELPPDAPALIVKFFRGQVKP